MRISSVLAVLLVGVFVSSPAFAGKVSYVDGRGQWVPTGCIEPKGPAVMARNAEAAADDMNARIAQHNAYANDANLYMNCISQEAERDAMAFGQLITGSAQALIDKTQAEVTVSSERVNAKSAVQ